uniref:ORF41 n=1 Tax=Latid herpesvirus 1 TaxID=3096545 RepID=A0AB33V6N3_9VIRU
MYFKEFAELVGEGDELPYKLHFVMYVGDGILKLAPLCKRGKKLSLNKKIPVTISAAGYLDPFMCYVPRSGGCWTLVFLRSIPLVIVNSVCSSLKLPAVTSALKEVNSFDVAWVSGLKMVSDREGVKRGLGQRIALVRSLREAHPADYSILERLPHRFEGLYTTVSSATFFNPTGTPEFLARFDSTFDPENGGAVGADLPPVRFARCAGSCVRQGELYDITAEVIGAMRKFYAENCSMRTPSMSTVVQLVLARKEYAGLHHRVTFSEFFHRPWNPCIAAVMGLLVFNVFMGKSSLCA